MPKSLGKKEDIQQSMSQMDGTSGDDYIKLEKTISYVTLLSADYAEAFEHWVPHPDKKKPKMRGTCAGGIKNAGWSPDTCPLCAIAAHKFTEKKKALGDQDEKLAKELNGQGLDLRASYRAFLIAAKGTAVVERRNGKKVETYDFDDFDGKPRILALTAAQMKLLLKVIESDEYADIEDGNDLVGHVLKITKKEKESKSNGKTYGEVVSIEPVGKVTLKVTGSLPKLDAFGAVDMDDLKKIAATYSGDVSEEKYAGRDAAGVDVDAAVAKAKAARAAKKK